MLSTTIHLNSAIIGTLSLLLAVFVFYTNAKEFISFSVKIFLQSIFSIFFKSIEVLGTENIPTHGPIIFTGNHMNQFVDAAVILVTCPQKVGFLIAEKSFHKRIVGDLAAAVGSIPVARPQDSAKKGQGKICFVGLKMIGQGTAFTSLDKKARIRPGRSPDAYRMLRVISDTEAELAEEPGETSPYLEKECQGEGKWVDYDVLNHIDQGKMFESVQNALAQGQCLGIFPEGGSHDNTDLLPLKAGVAAITFGTLDKFDKDVPIVPVGLNYFRGHRFRGRVVVEYGQPIHIDSELFKTYKESRRNGYQELLSRVEEGMRSVIVTANSYEDLKLLHTARRLYQRTTGQTTQQKQDLARRFSMGVKLLTEKNGGQLPPELKALQQRLEAYQDQLGEWGLKDHQVQTGLTFSSEDYWKFLYSFLHSLIIFLLASIPSLVLNAPVGAAAKLWSTREAKKDLKASRVKLAARDVLLSKKIIFSLVAVPVLWVTYVILLLAFTSIPANLVMLFFICCPIFSYWGVVAVEQGVINLKMLRLIYLRLLPGFQAQAKLLPQQRAQLAKEVRAIVKKYGPQLGALYFEKGNNWEAQINRMRRMGSNSDLQALETHASSTSLSSSKPIPVRASSLSTDHSNELGQPLQLSSSDQTPSHLPKHDQYGEDVEAEEVNLSMQIQEEVETERREREKELQRMRFQDLNKINEGETDPSPSEGEGEAVSESEEGQKEEDQPTSQPEMDPSNHELEKEKEAERESEVGSEGEEDVVVIRQRDVREEEEKDSGLRQRKSSSSTL